jgi:histidinol-phosphate phosphatase family protein
MQLINQLPGNGITVVDNLKKGNIHYLVLAGGKGTRSENPKIPKLLQEISPTKRVLDLLVENFVEVSPSRISFLISHLGNSIENELASVQRILINWTVDCIYDPANCSGTATSIDNAVEKSDYSYFAVIFGDTACSFNLELLRTQWDYEKSDFAFVVHPNLHPWDSDRIEVGLNSELLEFVPKSNEIGELRLPIRSISGILFFSKSEYQKITNFDNDVVMKIVKGVPKDKINVINSSYYQKDAGTQKRIQGIREDYASGAIARRGARLRPAIFLDRDGTIFADESQGRISVSSKEVRLDSIKAIERANSVGIPIFLVTNQPAVAKGFVSCNDVLRVQAQLECILLEQGAYLDDFRFCPHHPVAGFDGEIEELKIECVCRKPSIGMFTDLSDKHGIDLSDSFLIGDSEVDRQTAANARMTYVYASYEDDKSLALAITNSVDSIVDAN